MTAAIEHDPFDIPGQEEARVEAGTKARQAEETEEDDVRWLMGSRRGRRILWRLMDQAGVFRSSFSPTAMQMAYNEGHRNYGNRVLNLIHHHCPEFYPRMLKEHIDGQRNSRAKQ